MPNENNSSPYAAVAVGAAALIGAVAAGFAYYSNRNEQRNEEHRPISATNEATNMASGRATQQPQNQNLILCLICLERNNNDHTRAPCGHSFHVECLRIELGLQRDSGISYCCPHCRNPITP